MGRTVTRTLVILLLTGFVLYLLFLPKYSGYEHWEQYYTPGAILEEELCTCFGVETTDDSNMSYVKEKDCYGIPTNCQKLCYTYIGGKIKTEVPCKR